LGSQVRRIEYLNSLTAVFVDTHYRHRIHIALLNRTLKTHLDLIPKAIKAGHPMTGRNSKSKESTTIDYWQRVESALMRTQWACDNRHFSQAALIRRLMDLPLQSYLGCYKSESTIKSYLQGHLPKTDPKLIDRLMAAVAACFHVDAALFFDEALSKEAFLETIRAADRTPSKKLAALEAENQCLRKKLQQVISGLDRTGTGRRARFSWKAILSKPIVVMASVAGLLLGGALLWGFGGSQDPYPSRHAPEIASALLDGRDLLLNTPETPMQVAYGSQLCMEMRSPVYYASAFVADNGFYFNQEGRLLQVPNGDTPACTGIWPGIPDTFRSTPYQLFIVAAETRLPVTGDGDRRRTLPAGSYFGPIYIQRTQ
jgi:hypothetical protein